MCIRRRGLIGITLGTHYLILYVNEGCGGKLPTLVASNDRSWFQKWEDLMLDQLAIAAVEPVRDATAGFSPL